MYGAKICAETVVIVTTAAIQSPSQAVYPSHFVPVSNHVQHELEKTKHVFTQWNVVCTVESRARGLHACIMYIGCMSSRKHGNSTETLAGLMSTPTEHSCLTAE